MTADLEHVSEPVRTEAIDRAAQRAIELGATIEMASHEADRDYYVVVITSETVASFHPDVLGKPHPSLQAAQQLGFVVLNAFRNLRSAVLGLPAALPVTDREILVEALAELPEIDWVAPSEIDLSADGPTSRGRFTPSALPPDLPRTFDDLSL